MAKHKYAILILAAGSSERLGRPKQLVKWNESTLLNHTIEEALAIVDIDLYVALGGHQEDIQPSIENKVNLLHIENWREGMGASISSSMAQIDIEKYEGIILSVCDQPYISSKIFENLISEYEFSNASIIISKYKIESGPPSLFSQKHFPAMMKLRGDKGAKEIVRKNVVETSTANFLNGHIDIDDEDDLRNLTS